jgi:hypothetical protein
VLRPGMPGGVGQALPGHRDDVPGHSVDDGEIDGSREGDRRGDEEADGELVHEVDDREAGAAPLRPLEGEDDGADVRDARVEMTDGPPDPLRHRVVGRGAGDALELEPRREELLDDVVVEVPRDPAAVLDPGHPLLVRPGARQLHRETRLPGEVRGHAEVGHREAGGAGCPCDQEHPACGPGGDERHDHRGAQPRLLGEDEPQLVAVLEEARLPSLEHAVHGGVGGASDLPARAVGIEPARGEHGEPGPVGGGEQHAHHLRTREGEHAVDQHLDRVPLRCGHHGRGDLGRGGRPGLAHPGLRVEPRVLDRDAGRRGEGGDELLVLRAEPPRRAVAEVQVAVDRVAHPDGNPEEAVHRGVRRREPRVPRVLREVVEPDRDRLVDDGPEEPVTLGQMPDGGDLRLGHPDVDELLEIALGGHDAESPVLGSDQLDRRLDDAAEEDREIEVLDHQLVGPQQGAEAPLGELHVAHLQHQVVEHLIELASGLVREAEPATVGHRGTRPALRGDDPVTGPPRGQGYALASMRGPRL